MNFSDSRKEVCQNYLFSRHAYYGIQERNEEKSFVFFPLAFLALGSTRFLKKKAVFLHAKKHPVILAVLFYAAAAAICSALYVCA